MNDITELRKHLFETLQQLRDKENPLDIERAKAVSDIAQTIINSAKVEVDFMKQTGATSSSGFIPHDRTPSITENPAAPQLTQTGIKNVTHIPGATVTQHRMR